MSGELIARKIDEESADSPDSSDGSAVQKHTLEVDSGLSARPDTVYAMLVVLASNTMGSTALAAHGFDWFPPITGNSCLAAVLPKGLYDRK